MTNLINEAQRMQHLAGILAESQLEEAIASADYLEVGEEYNYSSGVKDLPPFKVKVVKIIGGTKFVGEVLEDNETTDYKGWKKGDRYQLDTTRISDKSDKQLSALNPVIEPKNDDEKNPKSTEAFNKVVAWAKENKLRTVKQEVNEFGPNDIYIRNWSNGPLDIIINTSKEKELIEFLKTLGGKMSKHHMDEETKGARIGLNFEEVNESPDIEEIVNEALKSVRK